MSSPGPGKVTKVVSPWSKDYHTPVATMNTDKILKSTLTDESHNQKGDTKTCLFCGLSNYFRPIRSRDHLVMGSGSKKVHRVNHTLSTLIVMLKLSRISKEMKERET